MPRKVAMAFEPDGVVLPLDRLLPLRKISNDVRYTDKYRRILASLREVGLIEPLMVYPQKGSKDTFLLLDGLLRWDALKNLGETEAFCLIATEDETYTYNQKVSQVSPIQETFMIRKALERGVSEERLAAALNIDIGAVRKKRNLLDGVCSEAVDLLKDTRISTAALAQIKRVKPSRQIEMIELMMAMRTFSVSYARCMYLATPADQRISNDAPAGNDEAISPEESVRLNREMNQLHRDIKAVEETHGETMLHLVLAVGYIKTLLANVRVVRHMNQHDPTILAELQRMVASIETEGSPQSAG